MLLFGNAQITTQALALLFSVGASVSFFSAAGRYRGQLVSPESGNVFVRLAQHRLYGEPAFRLAFARQLVATKLRAGRHLLARYAQNHKAAAESIRPALVRLDWALAQLGNAADAQALLGLEGSAAAAYFQARQPVSFLRRRCVCSVPCSMLV